jgi:hypothetical protein
MSPRRFRVSYRVSLVVAIPLLVLATGGVIAFRTFVASRATVDQLAEDLFHNVSAQTVVQARAQIRRAVPMVELARLLMRDNPALEQNSNALARQFTAILKANPEFSWVSYSNAAGDFTGAFRTAEGTYRTNQSAIHDGKTALVENDVDDSGDWKLHRRADDTHYDPRTRPFYTMAASAKRRVWTSPYVFFDAAVPGITCAQPNLAPDGQLLGVFTVDFDLNNLSRFVEKLRLSEHGRIFIFDEAGTVIAHPTVRLVEKSGQGAAGKLVTTADIDDPIVKAYFAAAPARAGEGFAFQHAGETWRASYTVFEIDDGLRWVVGAVAPERDFMGAVQRNNLVSLLVSLFAVALAVGLAFVLSSRVARPLAELASQMDEVGQLRLVDAPARDTLFAEIAMMDDALSRMKKGLRSFASYVPRDLVRAMLASGQEAVLAGDVKPLTIFFSDIAGFTTIAESMKPDALVKLLAGYFRRPRRPRLRSRDPLSALHRRPKARRRRVGAASASPHRRLDRRRPRRQHRLQRAPQLHGHGRHRQHRRPPRRPQQTLRHADPHLRSDLSPRQAPHHRPRHRRRRRQGQGSRHQGLRTPLPDLRRRPRRPHPRTSLRVRPRRLSPPRLHHRRDHLPRNPPHPPLQSRRPGPPHPRRVLPRLSPRPRLDRHPRPPRKITGTGP